MRRVALFAHHCVAHPLLFWTGDATWAVRLHDLTARYAFGDFSRRRAWARAAKAAEDRR